MPKRRVLVLRFHSGLNAGELRDARRMLEAAGPLARRADGHEHVYALRGVAVADNIIELTVALDGYGNVAEGVERTIGLVDDLLAPAVNDRKLSLASAKVRKA